MSDAVQIAVVTMVGGTLAAAVGGLVKIVINGREARARGAANKAAIEQIHILVNGNLLEALRRIDRLTKVVAKDSPGDADKAAAAVESGQAVERKAASDELSRQSNKDA